MYSRTYLNKRVTMSHLMSNWCILQMNSIAIKSLLVNINCDSSLFLNGELFYKTIYTSMRIISEAIKVILLYQ